MAVIDWDEEPVAAGESIVLQAYAVGGKEPYTYQWVDQMNEPVGSSDLFTCEASVNQTYRLEITSADGQTARTKALVPVIAPTLSVATFDDLFLESESNWMFDPDATPSRNGFRCVLQRFFPLRQLPDGAIRGMVRIWLCK